MLKVAVVGATDMVGREIIKTLAERATLPLREVVALASGRAVGQSVSFGEEEVLKVRGLEAFDFSDTDIAFFAASTSIATQHAPRAAAAGAMVIECSGQFHLEKDVPLLVPEVNPHALARARKRRIIANPTAASIQLALALKPLHDIAKVRRAVVTILAPVSGAGKEAMDELWTQSRGLFVNDAATPEQFPKQISFNCIPQTDRFVEGGATREEWALALETRKIVDPDILVTATAVRVPVFVGQGMAVHVEFEQPITEAQARAALRQAPGLVLEDKREDGGYVTPLEVVGEDSVFISRLRRDATVAHGLAFWCVADNLRKGAALNAVQIAEAVVTGKMLEGGQG